MLPCCRTAESQKLLLLPLVPGFRQRHSWNHPAEAESIDQILRDVASDSAAAQQEARSLDDIQKDVRRYLAAAEQPTTDAEHLASPHAINVLRGEFDCHPGDPSTRTALLGQLHQAGEE